MKIRVYYEDTDLGGVVYHTNYLKYCERARSEVFFGEGQNPFTKAGHFLVRDICCRFIFSATLGDELEIRSSLTGLKGASFSLTQKIYKSTQEIFTADLHIVYVSNKKPTKIPQEVRDLLKTKFS